MNTIHVVQCNEARPISRWPKQDYKAIEGYSWSPFVVARKAGRGRVRAEELDAVIGEYIDPSALLCTDTATNYKKFALIKGLKHEAVNVSKEG